MIAEAKSTIADWQQLARPALIAGAVGLVLCIVGALWMDEQFYRSFLVANLYWLAIGLGCLVLLMLQHLTGGWWGLVLRRILEAGSKTILLSAVLFLPLVLGLPRLYLWANPEVVEHDLLLQQKEPYLNVPFFLVRLAIYFVIWLGLAFVLNRLSVQYEQHPTRTLRRKMRLFSAPGLALYGLTITFASIDWVMSLDPHWFSSIFGVQFAVAQILPAFAFAILALVWLSSRIPRVAEAVTPVVWGDLGNLLLAFVMVWAYMGYSQFFLIWIGNIPEELVWYKHRMEGFWEWFSWGLIIFYFVVPFALLLSREVKRNPQRLMWVAGLILVMHFAYQFWLVMPTPEPTMPPPHSTGSGHVGGELHVMPGGPFFIHWLDVGAFVGVGGIWLACFLWCLQSRSLLPEYDLKALEEAQHGGA